MDFLHNVQAIENECIIAFENITFSYIFNAWVKKIG